MLVWSGKVIVFMQVLSQPNEQLDEIEVVRVTVSRVRQDKEHCGSLYLHEARSQASP